MKCYIYGVANFVVIMLNKYIHDFCIKGQYKSIKNLFKPQIVSLIFQICHQSFFVSKHLPTDIIKILNKPLANGLEIKDSFFLMNAFIEHS